MDIKFVYFYELIFVILILFMSSDSCLGKKEDSISLNTLQFRYLIDKRQKYPYLISLQKGYRSGRHFCNGALIGRDSVLTASFCCQKEIFDIFDVYAVGGTVETEVSKESIYNKVLTCMQHPKTSSAVYHNIAILRLKRSFKFSIHLKPIKMAIQNPPKDVILEAIGWGSFQSTETEQSTKDLQSLKLQVVEQSLCAKNPIIPQYNGTYMFCANIVKNFLKDFGFCVFDYGVPLTYEFKLYGIGFNSIICNVYSDKTEYNYFNNIAAYQDWINKVASIGFRIHEIPMQKFNNVGRTSMILTINIVMLFIIKVIL